MVRCPPAVPLRIVLTIRREHDAEDVYVTGTFDNWQKTVQLEKEGSVFKKTVELPKNKTQYKVCPSRPAPCAALCLRLPPGRLLTAARSLSSMATGVSTRARPRRTTATALSTTSSCPRTL